jgi:hypothetical protein
VAPALAEAIRRIHNGESVSSLFNQLGRCDRDSGLRSRGL